MLEARRSTINAIGSVISPTIAGAYDAFLAPPTKIDGAALALTPDLCAYLACFYVSCLVRYRPSALDERNNASARWLLDAFSSQAAIHLIHASAQRILTTVPFFKTALN
jgi:hypothetical protein